ncbi:MAG: thioredoxin [bacterium]|nr:thioredoxin [bacterium]
MIILNEENFENEVLKSGLPVLVDFYAIWCGPCQMAGPVLEKLSTEYEGKVKIGKLNVDESHSLAEKYNVSSVPTVILFKNGTEVNRQTGFVGEEGYRLIINDKVSRKAGPPAAAGWQMSNDK